MAHGMHTLPEGETSVNIDEYAHTLGVERVYRPDHSSVVLRRIFTY
jgi:hypothetical protein